MRTRELCRTALMTAVLCAVSPWTIPIGPVPLSAATLAVCLAGAVLGARRGGMAAVLYLMLGAAGLPVFSGFRGGIQWLAGPTGGFLIGYPVCAVISGMAADGRNGTPGARRFRRTAAMAAGMAACSALGAAWFALQLRVDVRTALTACVVPFLPGDCVKLLAASFLAEAMQRRGIAERR